jgi:hypothetical protein
VWSDSLLIQHHKFLSLLIPFYNGPELSPFILSEKQTQKCGILTADIGYNDMQLLYGKILMNGEFILIYLAVVD